MAAISTDEENYVRLSLLLTGISPCAVRAYFDQQFPPTDISWKLKKEFNKLYGLKLKRVINQTQWNLLFPYTGDPDSKKFDVTLMICLIRNLTSISQPQNGFDTLPLETETFPGADLARIKYYRNYLAHHDVSKIDTSYFNISWTQVADAVGRLGGQTLKQQCEELKVKSLDQSNKEILLEVKIAATETTYLKESINVLSTELTTLKKAHEDTVPWNIRSQITQKLDRWKLLDQKFVFTRAAKHILKCVTEYSCVTVTGSSGMGKTATICHVALQMKENGYDVIPVKDPSDVIKFHNPNRSTLFLVDDFCGTYTLHPSELDKWKSLNEDLKLILENKKTKIIVACRLQIYHDEKFRSISLFKSCVCNLLSESICMSPDERMLIATAYLQTDSSKIEQYADLYDFFPLLCHLYKENPVINISDFFMNPFSLYKGEIDKLYMEGAYGKYCVLALSVMFNNSVKEDWFIGDVTKEIQTVMENTLESCKMNRGTSRFILKDDLDSLIHTFFKKEDGVYKTIHDKLFDFLAFYVGNTMLSVLIKNTTSSFIRERFIFDSINTNDQYKIIIAERYEKMYIERLISDWEHGKVVDVFCNTNMKVADFSGQFKIHLKCLDMLFQKHLAYKCDIKNNDTVLIQCCFTGDIELIQWCFHHGVDINQSRFDGASPLFIACQERHREIMNMLLDKKADINKCKNDGASSLVIACQKGHTEIVNILTEKMADINKCKDDGASPLFIACQKGHREIVNILIQKMADINKCKGDGASPLFIASQNGHTEIVNILIEKMADINKCKDDGASPLFIASQNGHTEIVNILIEKMADINKCKDDGASPLFIACQKGHTEILNILIEKMADINKCKDDGASPLFIACQKGHTEIVNILLDKKADINKCKNDGASPLVIACQKGHREIVVILLSKKADMNKCKNDGASPLYIACQGGYREIVNILLDKKADISKCRETGASPLVIACQKGNKEIVKMLLEKKADINKCKNDGASPLFIACQEGHREIVTILLDKKADINMCRHTGASPLFIACQKGHSEIVNVLLDKKADISKCKNDGASPLFIACQKGHREIVDILLEKKADVSKGMDYEQSPLYISCLKGYIGIVKALLDNGAEINNCRSNGVSPLQEACKQGHIDIVTYLLNNGADVNHCDKEGQSSLLIACEKNHVSIVKILLEKGADYNKFTTSGKSPTDIARDKGHNEIVILLEKHKEAV